MANTRITYTKIEYLIGDPSFTEVRVHWISDEPGHPLWGGGCRAKRFSSKWDIVGLALGPVALALTDLSYLQWSTEGVEEYKLDIAMEEHIIAIRRKYQSNRGDVDTRHYISQLKQPNA